MNMRKIKLNAIAAVSENDIIGQMNKLPWHLPDDLKHFRQLTENGCVLMGRKTHLSIGKTLPNRLNLILTAQDLDFPGCQTVKSLQQAVNLALEKGHQQIFIIGGEITFWRTLPRVTTLHLTRVHAIVNGTTFFPWSELERNKWRLTFTEHHPHDERHAHSFTFLTYERK